MPFSEKDREIMSLALKEAEEAGKQGNFPIGGALAINGNLIDENTKTDIRKAKRLIKMSPALDRILPDWGYDPPYMSKQEALNQLEDSVINEEDAKDTFLQILYDVYYRGGHNMEFVDNMVKLGYDGLLVDRADGVKHVIVYDPSALNILNVEKYQNEESE